MGFAQDMSVHHSQAVDMASIALTKSTDNDVRTLAFDILTTQQNQLGQMQAWLTMWDQPLSKVGPYMEWMSSDSGSGHGSHGTSATMDMSHSGAGRHHARHGVPPRTLRLSAQRKVCNSTPCSCS